MRSAPPCPRAPAPPPGARPLRMCHRSRLLRALHRRPAGPADQSRLRRDPPEGADAPACPGRRGLPLALPGHLGRFHRDGAPDRGRAARRRRGRRRPRPDEEGRHVRQRVLVGPLPHARLQPPDRRRRDPIRRPLTRRLRLEPSPRAAVSSGRGLHAERTPIRLPLPPLPPPPALRPSRLRRPGPVREDPGRPRRRRRPLLGRGPLPRPARGRHRRPDDDAPGERGGAEGLPRREVGRLPRRLRRPERGLPDADGGRRPEAPDVHRERLARHLDARREEGRLPLRASSRPSGRSRGSTRSLPKASSPSRCRPSGASSPRTPPTGRSSPTTVAATRSTTGSATRGARSRTSGSTTSRRTATPSSPTTSGRTPTRCGPAAASSS